jgi:hypothetical protein
MEMKAPHRRHRHTAVVRHALRQHSGIPYEVERKVCSACARVLDERPVKRAAARAPSQSSAQSDLLDDLPLDLASLAFYLKRGPRV